MDIYNSKLWLSDLDEAISNYPEIKQLENSTILLTGATGLICSAIIDLLLRYNEHNPETAIKIIAAGRSEKKFNDRFSRYIKSPYLEFVYYDAAKDPGFDFSCDYIIHGASNTSPNTYVSEAVETMNYNYIGMKNLLDYAYLHKTKRLLYISSSEVYGANKGEEPCRENEYGYVDLLIPRSSYAVSKRATETLCISYSNEYGVEAVMVRPGHIYGPTASQKDKRVASLWSYAASCGEDIVMKSDGKQIRSYCYCLDCASAILYVLIKGENCHAYNISNAESIISIREMAQMLAKQGNVKLLFDIPSGEEKKAFNPMSNSSLNSESLEKLGWKGLFNAERGFSHTVTILKELKGNHQ